MYTRAELSKYRVGLIISDELRRALAHSYKANKKSALDSILLNLVKFDDESVVFSLASGLRIELPRGYIVHDEKMGYVARRNRECLFRFTMLEHTLDKEGNFHKRRESKQKEIDTYKFNKAHIYNLKARLIGESAGGLEVINSKLTFVPPNFARFTVSENVIVPKQAEAIACSCFLGGTVRRVKILGNVKVIPSLCFSHSNIEVIEFNNSVEELEYCSIVSCSVRELIFPKSLRYVRTSAIANNDCLTTVKFNGPVSVFGTENFTHCRALNTIRIPSGASRLRLESFSGCVNLRSLYIPSTVKSVVCERMQHWGSMANPLFKPGKCQVIIDAPIHLRSAFTDMSINGVRYYTPKSKANTAKQNSRNRAINRAKEASSAG